MTGRQLPRPFWLAPIRFLETLYKSASGHCAGRLRVRREYPGRTRHLDMNRPEFPGGSNFRENGAMENVKKKAVKYSPEVQERAVRTVLEHQGEHESQWATISSIAAKIGCTAETLRSWVRRAERNQGHRPGPT